MRFFRTVRVQGLRSFGAHGFRGFGFGFKGLGLRMQGSGFLGVWDLGFRACGEVHSASDVLTYDRSARTRRRG